MELLESLINVAEPFRPLLPLLAALLGAIVAWLAVHRVARLNARREAYGRYVGAAEIYANDLARWMQAQHSGLGSSAAKPITTGPVNEPLGAILLVAAPALVTWVQEAQQALSDLAAAATGLGDWTAAVRAWQDVRARLINRMREDSGSARLPDDFFVKG